MTAAFKSFNWLRGVADEKQITHLHRLILMRLCLYRDNKTGRCNPGIQVVADELAVFRTTVFRAIDAAIKCGWLANTSNHGGRVARNFVFTFPSNRSGTATVNRSGTATVKTPTVAAPHTNRSRTARQPSQAILQGTELPSEFAPEREKRTGKRTGKKERERARSPDGASLGGKRKRARAAKRRPAKRAQPAAELVTAADDDAFQKFAAIYPRKVELDDAREEFAKALEGGADAEAVVARAAVYAVERAQAIAAGDNPKYTPYPTTWLRKKKYNEPYPPGVIIDEAGNVVAIEDDDGDGDDSFESRFAEFQRQAGYKADGSW